MTKSRGIRVYRPPTVDGDVAYLHGPNGERWTIDAEDLPKVGHMRWSASTQGYARAPLDGGPRLRLHRVLMDAPSGAEVDHIDGDVTNNRKSNLRLCSHAENGRNIKKKTNNTSGHTGVSWSKPHRLWRAYIVLNNRQKHLGLFKSVEGAAAAYQSAAEQLFGEFRREKT